MSLIKRASDILGRRNSATNSLYSIMDQGFVSAASFLTTVCIGRYGGAEQLGFYSPSFLLMVTGIITLQTLVASPFVNLSANQPERVRANHAGGALVQAGIIATLAMLVSVVIATCVQLGNSASAALAFWTLAGAIPFILLRDFLRRFVFAGMPFREALCWWDVAGASLQLSMIATLGLTGTLTAASAWMAIGVTNAVIGLSWLLYLRHRFRVSLRRLRPAMIRNWRFGRWVFAAQAVTMFRGQAIYFLLAAIAGVAMSGALAACESIVNITNPLIHGIVGVLEPTLARAYAKGGTIDLGRSIRVSTQALAISAFPLCGLVETPHNREGQFDIVVTVLNNPSFPLLRFAVVDMSDAEVERPNIGFATLGNIAGRSNDFVMTKSGRLIHSMGIKHDFDRWWNRLHERGQHPARFDLPDADLLACRALAGATQRLAGRLFNTLPSQTLRRIAHSTRLGYFARHEPRFRYVFPMGHRTG